MAWKSLFAAATLMGSSLAAAATIPPVALGSVGSSFPPFADVDPTCGAVRPGVPELSLNFGYSGFHEARVNVEYAYPEVSADARLKLFFDADIDNGTSFPVCVHGYVADGIISPDDFQLEQSIFLGLFELGYLGEDISSGIDVTELLTLNGSFLGLQFSMDALQDSNGRINDIRLLVEDAQPVPEPAPVALFGVGALLVGFCSRRGRGS